MTTITLPMPMIYEALDTGQVTPAIAAIYADFSMTICFSDAEFHAALEQIPEQLIWNTEFVEVELAGERGSCWLVFHGRGGR